MKIGIVGAGRVGCACALAAVVRGSARNIVLVDRTLKRAKAVATDLRYGTPLCPKTTVVDGDYADLAEAALVMVTAGINEKAGGATDRNDPEGRLRLLDKSSNRGDHGPIVGAPVAPHIAACVPAVSATQTAGAVTVTTIAVTGSATQAAAEVIATKTITSATATITAAGKCASGKPRTSENKDSSKNNYGVAQH